MLTSESRLGKYVLKREIGGGGMGVVYLALDTQTGDTVVIKVPNIQVRASDAMRRQFFLEGRALALLRHRNIVAALAVSENAEPPFIAMEYIPGHTLAEELHVKGFFELQETCAMMRPLAKALDYIHNLEPEAFVHRDIKPGNIRLRNPLDPVLLDFGIVQMHDHTVIAGAGACWYMSPEQCSQKQNQPVGGASDQYSLAIVAFEMLTGKVPFNGTSFDVMNSHLHVEPPLPAEWNSGLKEVFRIALAKNPANRFASCGDFVEALAAAGAGRMPVRAMAGTEPPSSRPDVGQARNREVSLSRLRSVSGAQIATGLAALLAVLVVVGLFFAMRSGWFAESPARGREAARRPSPGPSEPPSRLPSLPVLSSLGFSGGGSQGVLWKVRVGTLGTAGSQAIDLSVQLERARDLRGCGSTPVSGLLNSGEPSVLELPLNPGGCDSWEPGKYNATAVSRLTGERVLAASFEIPKPDVPKSGVRKPGVRKPEAQKPTQDTGAAKKADTKSGIKIEH